VKITVDLNAEQAEALEVAAERLGVSAGELARAALGEILSRPAEEFRGAVERVLAKNEELYRRLSR